MIIFRNLDCVSCSSLQEPAGHAEGSAGHAEGPANPAEVGHVMLLGSPELGGPWKYKFIEKDGKFTVTPALTSYPVTRAVAISSNLIHPTRGA